MKRIVAAGCVVLHQFHAGVALGCGSTPDMFLPMLPAADARDVALDAALFVASNAPEPIAFALRREGVDDDGLQALVSTDAGSGRRSGETAERAAPPRDIETALDVASGEFGTDAIDTSAIDTSAIDTS